MARNQQKASSFAMLGLTAKATALYNGVDQFLRTNCPVHVARSQNLFNDASEENGPCSRCGAACVVVDFQA